jgi:hypothetical protein
LTRSNTSKKALRRAVISAEFSALLEFYFFERKRPGLRKKCRNICIECFCSESAASR